MKERISQELDKKAREIKRYPKEFLREFLKKRNSHRKCQMKLLEKFLWNFFQKLLCQLVQEFFRKCFYFLQEFLKEFMDWFLKVQPENFLYKSRKQISEGVRLINCRWNFQISCRRNSFRDYLKSYREIPWTLSPKGISISIRISRKSSSVNLAFFSNTSGNSLRSFCGFIVRNSSGIFFRNFSGNTSRKTIMQWIQKIL